jgi:hypothetical protein
MGGSPANAQQEKLVSSHQLDLSPHQPGWPPDPLMQRRLGEYARGDAAARPCGNPNDSRPADDTASYQRVAGRDRILEQRLTALEHLAHRLGWHQHHQPLHQQRAG